MMENHRPNRLPNRPVVILLLFIFGPMMTLEGQSVPSDDTAALQGIAGGQPGNLKLTLGSSLFLMIRDASTQAPIEGAQASFVFDPDADPITAVSDASGLLAFPLLFPGDFIVIFSAADYEDFVIPVTVLPGEIIVIATEFIPMVRKSSGTGPLMNLFFTVTDETDEPVTSPEITTDPSLGAAPIEVTAGVFAYLSIPLVEYDVTVSALGFDDKLVTIQNPDLFVDEKVVMRRTILLPALDCDGKGTAERTRRVPADLLLIAALLLLFGSQYIRRPRRT